MNLTDQLQNMPTVAFLRAAEHQLGKDTHHAAYLDAALAHIRELQRTNRNLNNRYTRLQTKHNDLTHRLTQRRHPRRTSPPRGHADQPRQHPHPDRPIPPR